MVIFAEALYMLLNLSLLVGVFASLTLLVVIFLFKKKNLILKRLLFFSVLIFIVGAVYQISLEDFYKKKRQEKKDQVQKSIMYLPYVKAALEKFYSCSGRNDWDKCIDAISDARMNSETLNKLKNDYFKDFKKFGKFVSIEIETPFGGIENLSNNQLPQHLRVDTRVDFVNKKHVFVMLTLLRNELGKDFYVVNAESVVKEIDPSQK